MNQLARLLTAEDLWNLPKDGMLHELVRGELRTMPPAGFEHGSVSVTLTILLGQHVRAKKLGVVVSSDTGFLLSRDPDTVRAPDVAFVRKERVEAEGMVKKFWPGAPDLLVEVVSPSDRVNEVDEKVEDWLTAGARLVWVVNPKTRTVTVHQPGANPAILSAADTLDGGSVVPGFSCRVAEVFV